MLNLRFNHVFYGLMGLSAASAFLIPPRISDRFAPQLQVLFAPVARPTRAIAEWTRGRPSAREVGDDRPVELVLQQNSGLAAENIKLHYELEELRRRSKEREGMSEALQDLCVPVPVIGVGADAGQRESLALQGSTLEGLKDGMFVVYPGGVVGTLQRSGIAGGQVQLVTNPGFRLTVYFSSYRKIGSRKDKTGATPEKGEKDIGSQFVKLNDQRVLIEGVGDGKMICRGRATKEDVKEWGLSPGDYVVVDDPDCPKVLNGLRIGRVTAIRPSKTGPLHVDIEIAPASDLKRLREVMVLTNVK